MQDGDASRDLTNERHIVLDREHGHSVRAKRAHHFAGGESFLRGHAGCRLVEQQEFRSQTRGHSELQPLLLSVAQISRRLMRLRCEIEERQSPSDLAIEALPLQMMLKRDLQILRNAQRLEDARYL